MGHQIGAGERRSINFTAGANLVVFWCNRFTPRVKPPGMTESDWHDATWGVTDISPEAVKKADAEVPEDFATARDAGLIDAQDIDVRDFEECREFLKWAASNGHGIDGSS